MSARRALAAAAVVVLAAAAVPWSDGPLRRLAGGEGEGRQPSFDVPLDARMLTNAAASLPDDTLYATSAPDASPLVQGNLKAAGQLYLSRQLPVQDIGRASIVFTYRNGAVVSMPR